MADYLFDGPRETTHLVIDPFEGFTEKERDFIQDCIALEPVELPGLDMASIIGRLAKMVLAKKEYKRPQYICHQ